MIEITNITKGPIQLVLKSKSDRPGKRIAVKNLPGIGANKNTYVISEEQMTDQIKKLEKEKFIKIKS